MAHSGVNGFATPVRPPAREITQVKVRKPTVRDLKALEPVKGAAARTAKMIELLTGLSAQEVAAIHAEDMKGLGEITALFFRGLEEVRSGMSAFSASLRIEVADQVSAVVGRITRSISELGGRSTAAATESVRELGKRLSKLSELTGNATPKLRGLTEIFPALGAFQIGRVLAGSAEKAREILQLSRTTGIATDRLQELRFAAEETGAGTEDLGKGLTALTAKAVEAKGGGAEAVKAFADLGVSVEDLKALAPDQVFGRAADGLARIEDPARRAELATAIFGESGAKLLPLLLKGSSGIDQMAASAREAGIGLSQDALTAADGASDAFGGLTATLSGLGAALGVELLGALKPVIEAIRDFVKANPGISKALLAMTAGAVAATAAVVLLGAAFSPLTLLVAGVGALIGVLVAAFVLIRDNFDSIVTWFGQLWERLKGFFVNNIDKILIALGPLGWIASVLIQNWSSITEFFSRVWTQVTGIFSSALDQISAAFDGGFVSGVLALPDIVSNAMADVVKAIFGIDLREIGQQWMEPFKAAISGTWDEITTLFKNAGVGIANQAIRLITYNIDRVNTLANYLHADFLKINRIAEFGPAQPAGASDAAQPGFLPDGSLALKTQNEIGIGLKVEAPPGFKVTSSTVTSRNSEDEMLYRGARMVPNH